MESELRVGKLIYGLGNVLTSICVGLEFELVCPEFVSDIRTVVDESFQSLESDRIRLAQSFLGLSAWRVGGGGNRLCFV